MYVESNPKSDMDQISHSGR